MHMTNYTVLFATLSAILLTDVALAQPSQPIHPDKARVIEHWSKERMANAIPRDLVIDQRGLGYLRKPDGSLEPYGHRVSTSDPNNQSPFGKPSGGEQDGAPPVISGMDPDMDATIIGDSYTFSAVITDDASGVKSVSFVITHPGGATQSFRPNDAGNDTWEIPLSGFSNGDWQWQVVAKDGAAQGGNTATSNINPFTVDTNDSGGGSGGGTGGGTDTNIVVDAEWTAGGTVQTAAGRIYFEMPGNAKRKGPWIGYVCSGTVATDDNTDGRSIVITAAHCVYDDSNKAFARNVLFIPNQAGTTSSFGTDRDCSNDPMGCWVPSFGVVDTNWTASTFPNNVEWDYAYYVVSDSGAHSGTTSDTVLDNAAGSLPINFTQPLYGYKDDTDYTHALGYSYKDDPNFMFCAEGMDQKDSVNWWLPSCELTGGSSGGPWVQPMTVASGSGPIISVNSWGYTNAPGMAGPRLDNSTAGCLFIEAITKNFAPVPESDGDAGVAVTCSP
jgi:hypothetical protein